MFIHVTKWGRRLFLVLLAGLYGSVLPAAPAEEKKSIEAVRAEQPLRVDGILDEPVWQRPGRSDFLQVDPDEGQTPTEITSVWVAFDDAALYVAARLHDRSPREIVQRLGRRDTSPDADWFYVGIDSYHDRRTGFYFQVFAGGAITDGTLYNDSWDDSSWDAVWESAARADEQGWTVEMKIPFSQLRFNRRDEYTWGINFMRHIQRRKETDEFVLVRKADSGWVSRFSELTGICRLAPPHRIEVLPYVAAGARFLHHDDGDPFRSGGIRTTQAGADLKFGLGSNLTLNASVNPDFGQVEVDPAVVNLSQYETFFDEKRPFFIEGAGFFNFGSGGANSNWSFNFGNPEHFYSRRIGRPPQGSVQHEGFVESPDQTTILTAAKLSGKIGDDWSVGFLNAFTAREYAQVEQGGRRYSDEVEPFTWYGVYRGLREFHDGRQALGFIGTTTVRTLDEPWLGDEFNRRSFVFGMDGWTNLDLDQMWVLTGWFSTSRVTGTRERITSLQQAPLHYFQRPDAHYVSVDETATTLGGYAGRVALNKQKGNWRFNAALGMISPGFDTNDLGFLFRTDLINAHVVVGYQWFEPDGVFRRKNFNLAAYRSYDYGGRRTGEGYFLFSNTQFMNYWGLSGQFFIQRAALDTRSTRGGPAMMSTTYREISLSGYSDSRRALVASAGFSAGRSNSGGYRVETWSELEWKPGSGLRVQFSPDIFRDVTIAQWVGNFTDSTATATYGSRYVFGKLDQREVSARIRVDWTFTPRLSLQVFLQPLVSVGSYNRFEELRQPGTYTFNLYGENGSTIAYAGGDYTVDPDGPGGPAAPFVLANPDFNYKSLRANVVLRWEYRPGSAFYAVWTQSRVNPLDPGQFNLWHDVRNILSGPADNVFMLKLTYWWNP